MEVSELTPMVSFHFQRVSGVRPSLHIEDVLAMNRCTVIKDPVKVPLTYCCHQET